MKRRNAIVTGAALVLAVGAGGQVALYHHNTPSSTAMRASWTFHPQTGQEVRAHAQSIVLGRVESVTAGPDIVTQQPGEPGGVDRIPTRRVTVTVLKHYKGAAAEGQRLTLFQTGGSELPAAPARGTKAETHVKQVTLENDPAYRAGEQYLLMLEPGPQDTVRPVSPEGRYRLDSRSGALTPMVSNAVTSETVSKSLAALEPTLQAG